MASPVAENSVSTNEPIPQLYVSYSQDCKPTDSACANFSNNTYLVESTFLGKDSKFDSKTSGHYKKSCSTLNTTALNSALIDNQVHSTTFEPLTNYDLNVGSQILDSVDVLPLPLVDGIDFYASPQVFSTESNNYLVSAPKKELRANPLPCNSYTSRSNNLASNVKYSCPLEDFDLLDSTSEFWNIKNDKTGTAQCLDQIFETRHNNGSTEKNNMFYKKGKLNTSNGFVEKQSPKPSVEFSNVKTSNSAISVCSLQKSSTDVKKFCPQCKLKYSENRPLKFFRLSLEESILLCSTKNCTYPIETPNETFNIQKETSIENSFRSKIDFDINNISINTRNIQDQLPELRVLMSSFLHSLNKTKKDYEKFMAGDLSENYEQDGDNVKLLSLINEVFEVGQGNNEAGHDHEMGKSSEPPKIEACESIKQDEDSSVELQKEDIKFMLEQFI